MIKKYVKGLKDLVGFQLMDLTDEKILVRSPDGENYTLFIKDDKGDCCGFNDITTTLKIKRNSKTNPIITKVSISNEDEDEGNRCYVTFYGDSKALGAIDTYSSSGSGWIYGANVTVRCDSLSLFEFLSSW
jgi:hypothetical protein